MLELFAKPMTSYKLNPIDNRIINTELLFEEVPGSILTSIVIFNRTFTDTTNDKVVTSAVSVLIVRSAGQMSIFFFESTV